jgi:hypothetical protein
VICGSLLVFLFSFGHCTVCPFLIIMSYEYSVGIFKLFLSQGRAVNAMIKKVNP